MCILAAIIDVSFNQCSNEIRSRGWVSLLQSSYYFSNFLVLNMKCLIKHLYIPSNLVNVLQEQEINAISKQVVIKQLVYNLLGIICCDALPETFHDLYWEQSYILLILAIPVTELHQNLLCTKLLIIRASQVK